MSIRTIQTPYNTTSGATRAAAHGGLSLNMGVRPRPMSRLPSAPRRRTHHSLLQQSPSEQLGSAHKHTTTATPTTSALNAGGKTMTATNTTELDIAHLVANLLLRRYASGGKPARRPSQKQYVKSRLNNVVNVAIEV